VWKQPINARETPTASSVTQNVTIDGQFFTHLRDAKDQSQLSFLDDIITRLILEAYKVGWPLETHFPVINN
jgi:hypothetical protein